MTPRQPGGNSSCLAWRTHRHSRPTMSQIGIDERVRLLPAKARRKGLNVDSPVTGAMRRDALSLFARSAVDDSPSLAYLRGAFAKEERTAQAV